MTDEPKRLNEVRTSEQSLLHAYGWTDEKAGVAHIQIDEAKKLTVERGLVVRQDPLTDEHLGTRRPASGESSSGRNVTRTLAPAAASGPAPAPAGHEAIGEVEHDRRQRHAESDRHPVEPARCAGG